MRRFSGGLGWAALVGGMVFLGTGCGARNRRYEYPRPYPEHTPAESRRAGTTQAPASARGRSHETQAAALTAPMPPAEPAWEPAVAPRPWQWIVLHHSATHKGSAATFDYWHRHHNHWDELGYHFVIGNGSGSGNGRVEVGSRWPKQKHGAHCRVGNDQTYNQTGIGICLVGDFRKTRPTTGQMDALVRLVDWLTARYGIPDSHVVGHGDVDVTDCPGRYFSRGELLRRVAMRREGRRRAALARNN